MNVSDVESMLNDIPSGARSSARRSSNLSDGAMHTDSYRAGEFSDSDFADSESTIDGFRAPENRNGTAEYGDAALRNAAFGDARFDDAPVDNSQFTDADIAAAQGADAGPSAGPVDGADTEAHAARRSSSE